LCYFFEHYTLYSIGILVCKEEEQVVEGQQGPRPPGKTGVEREKEQGMGEGREHAKEEGEKEVKKGEKEEWEAETERERGGFTEGTGQSASCEAKSCVKLALDINF